MHIHGFDRWAIAYDQCQRCGTKARPHKARGYCSSCYSKLYEARKLKGTMREREWRDWVVESFLEELSDYLWQMYQTYGIDTGVRRGIPRNMVATNNGAYLQCDFCHRQFINIPTAHYDRESGLCWKCLEFVTRPEEV